MVCPLEEDSEVVARDGKWKWKDFASALGMKEVEIAEAVPARSVIAGMAAHMKPLPGVVVVVGVEPASGHLELGSYHLNCPENHCSIHWIRFRRPRRLELLC